jgi:hypothetical protein
MKQLKILASLALTALVAACGSSSSTPPPAGFPKPAGTVAVNFSVDDSINKLWKAGELEWKGSMNYDPTTRKITLDPNWSSTNTWAPLYDDGPWTSGGHEPSLCGTVPCVAGDHIWGVTVFATPPATGTDSYGYGLRDATNPDKLNGGWVWIGSAGTFDVPAGATAEIKAQGMAFPAHGTVDLRLAIDTNALDTGTWTGTPQVKGSAWGWTLVNMYDDATHGDATAADGIYTFTLSNALDPTKPPYPGLMTTGDIAQFVFTFNAGAQEYKVGGAASAVGVAAQTKKGTAAWATTAVQVQTTGDKNTYVTAP